jgi:flagellar biosynthesis protein FlhB
VPRSADLNAAAGVLAATGALYFVGTDLASGLTGLLRQSLSAAPWTELEAHGTALHIWKLSELGARAVLPFLGLLFVAAVAINLVQVGFMVTTEPLQPNWSRLNPIEGFKRILSLKGGVKLVISLLKLLVLCAIVAGFVIARLPAILGSVDLSISMLCQQIGSALVAIAFQLSIGLAVLALADYGYQLWNFEQDIRMTKQEVREEMRHMEGDPHIRQRRREAHRKLSKARQVQQAKNADVIITNPTEIAIAIKYEPKKMEAPIVLAKGKGTLAAQIRQVAAQHGIPIVEKKPLAQALYRDVKVGHPIPVELYEAVAEILAYVYRMANKRRKAV